MGEGRGKTSERMEGRNDRGKENEGAGGSDGRN